MITGLYPCSHSSGVRASMPADEKNCIAGSNRINECRRGKYA